MAMSTAPDSIPPSPASSSSVVASLPPVFALQMAPRSRLGAFFVWIGKLVIALTTMINLFLLVLILGAFGFLFGGCGKGTEGLHERFQGGKETARDKIAVIRIEG